MTSAQMQITFAHRPILKLARKSSLPRYKKLQEYLHRALFFLHFSCFRLMVVIFPFPRDSLSHHWYWQGRDTPHLTQGKRKIYLEPKHCVLYIHDFVTHLHNFNDYRIFGWYFWQCFLMTPSHQSGQRKNHCKENIPRAEYYFLCEDILYSLCIHKKKAMKAGQSIM